MLHSVGQPPRRHSHGAGVVALHALLGERAFCADFKFFAHITPFLSGCYENVAYITQTFLGFCQVGKAKVSAFVASLKPACARCNAVFPATLGMVDYFPRNSCD